jgi:hypothetical protein
VDALILKFAMATPKTYKEMREIASAVQSVTCDVLAARAVCIT